LTGLPPTVSEMYERGPLAVPRPYAEALHSLVRRERPELALEIGCAMGTSTVAILSALAENGTGKLISVDPFQSTAWENRGRGAVARAGFEGMHELVEDFDYHALPDLLREGQRAGLVYIDGVHTFDYVLLDTFYGDKLLEVGGVIGFNDCGWRSVGAAIRFIRHHRRYEELDVGLPADYRGRIPVVGGVAKRLQDRPNRDRYFRKLSTFEPGTDFYVRL
jgi:hypothetical protein